MTPDPRVNAYRDDVADARLKGRVAAPRYVAGREARVIVGMTSLHRRPGAGAPIDTFLHHGESVLVFDEANGRAWCQALRDGYVGYVRNEALAAGGAPTPTPTHYLANLGAYRYAEPDLRSPAIDFLPRHCAVAVAEAGLTTRDTEYARLVGGGFLPAACLAAAPPRSPDLATAAALYLGCPYLWGGRSWLGFDCSGLVQEAFRDLGVAVPRDTDMQRDAVGVELTIASLDELRRDDLIFRPGHVMIAAGDGAVIHADGGTMTVRRDALATLLQRWGCGIGGFVVRRPG